MRKNKHGRVGVKRQVVTGPNLARAKADAYERGRQRGWREGLEHGRRIAHGNRTVSIVRRKMDEACGL